jgi:uncharacterized membrane protein (UPF0127 family)
MRAVVVASVLVGLLGCDGDESSSNTSSTATTSANTSSASTSSANTSSASTPAPNTAAASSVASPAGETPEGFERVAATAVTADGTVCELCLWLADTADLRRRGLMGVTDLGDADGMVFRYPSPTSTGFWMKDTVLPLSIAFYSADGSYLADREMQPCTADPCPTYTIEQPFLLAVETTLGGLAALGLTPGSTLTLGDVGCATPPGGA